MYNQVLGLLLELEASEPRVEQEAVPSTRTATSLRSLISPTWRSGTWRSPSYKDISKKEDLFVRWSRPRWRGEITIPDM
jgi:hypothetical protein